MSVYYFLAVPCFLWAGVCWLGLKEANRRIEALQQAWPAAAEAVTSEDLSILRELFGAEFLTGQYFLKQMERAEV